MNRWFSRYAIALGFLIAWCVPCGADTIVLKSGKTVSGQIIEETPEYVRVQLGENPVYYQRAYITEISRDQVQTGAPAAPIESAVAHRETETREQGGSSSNDADYLAVGLRLASEGQWDAAEETFRKGEVENPYDSNILGALDLVSSLKAGRTTSECALATFKGTYAMLREDYSDAVVNLERAQALDPSQPDISYNLGVAYFSMGEFDKALEALRRVLRIKPDDAPTYVLVGNIYQLLGEKEKARENFDMAQTLFDGADREFVPE